MKFNKKHMFILGTLWKTYQSHSWVTNMTHLYVQLKINTYLALDFQFDLILHCRTHSMCGKTKFTKVMYIKYFLQYSSRKFNWIQTAADKTDLPSTNFAWLSISKSIKYISFVENSECRDIHQTSKKMHVGWIKVFRLQPRYCFFFK